MTRPDRPDRPDPIARAQAEQLACAMLRHGARLSLVALATGLSTRHVKSWQTRLFPDRLPRRGPFSDAASNRLAGRIDHLHGAILAALYVRAAHDAALRTVEWMALISACENYLRLVQTPRLDINDGWLIARDLRAGLATLVTCPDCGRPHLKLTEPVLAGCPACVVAAGASRPRARELARARGQTQSAALGVVVANARLPS